MIELAGAYLGVECWGWRTGQKILGFFQFQALSSTKKCYFFLYLATLVYICTRRIKVVVVGCIPPPHPHVMTCGLLIQLVFCLKKLCGLLPFLSGAPPRKRILDLSLTRSIWSLTGLELHKEMCPLGNINLVVA